MKFNSIEDARQFFNISLRKHARGVAGEAGWYKQYEIMAGGLSGSAVIGGNGDLFLVVWRSPMSLGFYDEAVLTGGVKEELSSSVRNILSRCALVGFVPIELLALISEYRTSTHTEGLTFDDLHASEIAEYEEMVSKVR